MKKIRKRKTTVSWKHVQKRQNRHKARRAFRKEERRREEQARWRQIFGKKRQPQPERRLTAPRQAVAMKSLMNPMQRLGNSVKNMLMRSAKVAPGE